MKYIHPEMTISPAAHPRAYIFIYLQQNLTNYAEKC